MNRISSPPASRRWNRYGLASVSLLLTGFIALWLHLATQPAYAADTNCGNVNTMATLNTAINCVNAAGAGTHTFQLIGNILLTASPTMLNNTAATMIVINGKGFTIDGQNLYRIFYVRANTRVTTNNLTMTKGKAGSGGCLYNVGKLTLTNSTVSFCTAGDGGGIYNVGELNLNGATVSYNAATGSVGMGGGIYHNGTAVNINNSTLSYNSARYGGAIESTNTMNIVGSILEHNTALENGGAIQVATCCNLHTLTILDTQILYNEAGVDGGGLWVDVATTTFKNSTIGHNSAQHEGGGLYIARWAASVTLAHNTVSYNTANLNGGGIANTVYLGQLTVVNSTISNNAAQNGNGGGVYNNENQTVDLTNSTITANAAPNGVGGGLYNKLATTNLLNSIIAHNTTAPNCFKFSGIIKTNGHNLDSDNSCFLDVSKGDLPNGNAQLGPLQNNGGATETHALVAGSQALDAGDAAKCAAAPVLNVDQRNIARPQGVRCDIGAFESTTTTAYITIVKDARPNSNQNFTFKSTVGGFALDDAAPDDGDVYTNTKSLALPAGVYTFTEQTAWHLTDILCTPADRAVVDLTAKKVTVTARGADNITCTFVNQRPVTVRVRKFNDLNADGWRDGSDGWLAGVTFKLYDAAGVLVGTQVTNSLGKASFTNVRAGRLTVCEELQVGWANTQPGFMDLTYNQPCYTVNLSGAQIATLTYGNTTAMVAAALAQAAQRAEGMMIAPAMVEVLPDDTVDLAPTVTDDLWLNTPEVQTTVYLPLMNR